MRDQRDIQAPRDLNYVLRGGIVISTRDRLREFPGDEREFGSITPILTVAPMGDPLNSLVFEVYADDVEAIIVESRPVKWKGK